MPPTGPGDSNPTQTCETCKALKKACEYAISALDAKLYVGAYTPGAQERALHKLREALKKCPTEPMGGGQEP